MVDFLRVLQVAGLLATLSFAAWLWFGLRRRSVPPAGTRPPVSVLVAARNEEAHLPGCLSSLAAQDYPPELCEYLIIDDASTDGTSSLVREWARRDTRFHLLSLEESAGKLLGPKKRALSEGIKICRGEIIMITDADCLLPPRWVSSQVGCFADDVSVVCGPVKYKVRKNWSSQLAAFESLVNAVLNAAVIGAGGALSCSGANFAYRRSAFQMVGGFDRGSKSFSGDDDLLLQRFRKQGLNIRYCFDPQAWVETEGPQDSQAYWLRKRRHLSAGRRYALPLMIMAAVIYLACLTFILLCVLGIVGIQVGYSFLFGWGALALTLILLFHRGLARLDQKGWLVWTIPAALLFPVYIVLLHPLTLLPSPAWKGRTVIEKREHEL